MNIHVVGFVHIFYCTLRQYILLTFSCISRFSVTQRGHQYLGKEIIPAFNERCEERPNNNCRLRTNPPASTTWISNGNSDCDCWNYKEMFKWERIMEKWDGDQPGSTERLISVPAFATRRRQTAWSRYMTFRQQQIHALLENAAAIHLNAQIHQKNSLYFTRPVPMFIAKSCIIALFGKQRLRSEVSLKVAKYAYRF